MLHSRRLHRGFARDCFGAGRKGGRGDQDLRARVAERRQAPGPARHDRYGAHVSRHRLFHRAAVHRDFVPHAAHPPRFGHLLGVQPSAEVLPQGRGGVPAQFRARFLRFVAEPRYRLRVGLSQPCGALCQHPQRFRFGLEFHPHDQPRRCCRRVLCRQACFRGRALL